MAIYQLWVLDETFTPVALLNTWHALTYRIALNAVGNASVSLAPNDPNIVKLEVMQRLRIVRDGEDVWGGPIVALSWGIAPEAPQNDTYTIDALDDAIWAAYRTIPRPEGEHFDTVTDSADDVAKSFVRRHMGSSAAAERQVYGLSVEADTGQVGSTTRSWVGGTLLEHLQRLAEGRAFWWRFVPSATGMEFKTAYPLWGVDRTLSNGANDELVFSLDRGNVSGMAYKLDVSEHYNCMYVAGAGEGKDQVVVTRSDSAYIASYGRRERWISATQYTDTDDLNDEGDQAIAEARPVDELSVTPQPGACAPQNLGDKCTLLAFRYGREFRADAIIVGMTIEVTADGVEQASLELMTA